MQQSKYEEKFEESKKIGDVYDVKNRRAINT